MIKRIVKLTFQEDKTDAFIAIFEESKNNIRSSEGCLHLELLRSNAPDNVFFTFSIWESEAHLNQYRRSKLFEETWKKIKILFSDRPQAWSTQLLSTPDL